jgi:hypothetical protein
VSIIELASLASAAAAFLAAGISYVSLRKVAEVHVSINSRMSELLEAAKHAARADGVVQGRAEWANTNEAENK